MVAAQSLPALPHVPLRMVGDRILVLRDEPLTQRGLLVIPDAAQRDKREGIVMKTGPGRLSFYRNKVLPPSVEAGDHIVWSKYASETRYGTQGERIVLPPLEGFGPNPTRSGRIEERFVWLRDDDLKAVVRNGKLVPLHDGVFVERKLPDDKTEGGLFIPDQAKQEHYEGTITAIGPGPWGDDGHERLSMEGIEVGDYVYWRDQSGMTLDALSPLSRPGYETLVVLYAELLVVKKSKK